MGEVKVEKRWGQNEDTGIIEIAEGNESMVHERS